MKNKKYSFASIRKIGSDPKKNIKNNNIAVKKKVKERKR